MQSTKHLYDAEFWAIHCLFVYLQIHFKFKNFILLKRSLQLTSLQCVYVTTSLQCVYDTPFAKTQNNDAFLEIQVFKSVSFVYLKLCSVTILMLYYKYFLSYKAR